MTIDQEKFNNLVKEYFKTVQAKEADQALQETGSLIFTGRSTCPYCRKFIWTLVTLIEEHDHLAIMFLNSEDPNDQAELEKFREKYDISTVPGFIFTNSEGKVESYCDSSLSVSDLENLLKL